MSNKKSSQLPKSDFDINENEHLFTFNDEAISDGKYIAEVTFDSHEDLSSNTDIDVDTDENQTSSANSTNSNILTSSTHNISENKCLQINNYAEKLFDNRTIPIPNGAAPSINNEILTIRRSYIFRTSTIRKLNKLKSIHPDINACVSTIVDVAEGIKLLIEDATRDTLVNVTSSLANS